MLLRPCETEDFAAIKVYRQDPESCQYIRPPESDERIREIVAQHCEPWVLEEGRWNGTIIALLSDHTAIGEMHFRICDWQNQRAELGYRVNKSFAGRGIATEAARLLIDYLFNSIGLHKVIAQCDPRNISSYKVMEKLGMKREGYFKQHFLIGSEWTDQLDYGLLKSDWKT